MGIEVKDLIWEDEQYSLVKRLGTSELDDCDDEDSKCFFSHRHPVVPGFIRTDNGTFVKSKLSVLPHTDSFLACIWSNRKEMDAAPDSQLSVFWLLSGFVYFGLEGHKAVRMGPTNYVVFDHRLQHFVMPDHERMSSRSYWYGAAWQLGNEKYRHLWESYCEA